MVRLLRRRPLPGLPPWLDTIDPYADEQLARECVQTYARDIDDEFFLLDILGLME